MPKDIEKLKLGARREIAKGHIQIQHGRREFSHGVDHMKVKHVYRGAVTAVRGSSRITRAKDKLRKLKREGG